MSLVVRAMPVPSCVLGIGFADDQLWSCAECTPEHASVLLASAGSVQSAYVTRFSLEQHCADGHRPYNVKCH